MKSAFAVACLAIATQAQSLDARVAAISNDCCGPKNLACDCTYEDTVYEPVEVCTDRVEYKAQMKLEMRPTTETRMREIKKTVMVPETQQVKQLRTV
jgi:hypothetical protein